MKAIAYEIINHGPEHSQYFQGCGTAFTDFDFCETGIGDNAKEAYNDAIEGLYTMDIDGKSLDKLLPKNPHGIRKTDKLTKGMDDEYYWHVSIRIKIA